MGKSGFDVDLSGTVALAHYLMVDTVADGIHRYMSEHQEKDEFNYFDIYTEVDAINIFTKEEILEAIDVLCDAKKIEMIKDETEKRYKVIEKHIPKEIDDEIQDYCFGG